MALFHSILLWLEALIPRLLFAAVIVAGGFLLLRPIMELLHKALAKTRLEKAAFGLITTLVRTILLGLLGLSAASALGIDVTGIVALASVVTLALSLALQNMLANMIGGFTILYTHPFHSGDFVEIAGQSGTVSEIGISYTKLLTPDNKLISIPNSAVVAAQIINHTSLGIRRLDIPLSLSLNADPRQVADVLCAAAKAESRVLTEPEPPRAVLLRYGKGAAQYSLRCWVKSDDYWECLFALNERIQPALESAGIPFSSYRLQIHEEK